MSACIVPKDLIDALTTFAVNNDLLDGRSREQFGQNLWNQNVRSVNYHYIHDEPEPVGSRFEWSACCEAWVVVDVIDDEPEPFENYCFESSAWSEAWIVEACGCFNDQSCETPDWEQTAAYHATEAMQALALGRLGMNIEQFRATQ